MSEAGKRSDDILAKAINAADLLDYQNDAVVSKTVIDEATGTLTVFAFDKGQGLSEHTAPFDAFAYILDGKAEIIISGNSLHMEQGEMVIMPANEPHALNATDKFKMLLVMIRS